MLSRTLRCREDSRLDIGTRMQLEQQQVHNRQERHGDKEEGSNATLEKQTGESQVLAALKLAAFEAVSGGRHADIHHVVAGGLVVRRPVCNLLL